MKKKLFYIVYICLQCTWGLGQTLIGFIVFLLHLNCPHRFWRGCIETRWNSFAGLSLGLFIFTPAQENNEVRVHEYGHTFQSLILGPLYAITGVVSMTWGCLPVFVKMRRDRHVKYTACFVEAEASHLGEKITGEKALW